MIEKLNSLKLNGRLMQRSKRMDLDKMKRTIDEAFEKERIEQESLIIKKRRKNGTN